MKWSVTSMRAFLLCAFAISTVAQAGCAIERAGVNPPVKDFYYPVGVLAHPGGRYVYVFNSNYDLRFNAAYVSVIDLEAVKPFDALDSADPYNLNAIVPNASQKLLAFPGLPSFSSDGSRMFVPTRDENTLFIFDVSADGSTLSCLGAGKKPYRNNLSCDQEHAFALTGKLFSSELDDTATVDPFVMAVLPPQPGVPTEYLFLAHLSSGAVTAYDITANALTNPQGFAAAGLIGLATNGTGAISVASGPGRAPSMYVGSRRLNTVSNPSPTALFTFQPMEALRLRENVTGALDLGSSIGGSDVKFLLTSPNTERTYMLLNEPNALVSLDSSIDLTGAPVNRLLDSQPLGRTPSTMVYVTKPEGDLLYVTSLSDDQISIFDARSLAQVGSIDLYPFAACGQTRFEQCSAAPYGLTVSYTPAGPRVLATMFNNDAVVVIDASAASPAAHRIVARIGSPRSKK